MGKLQYNVTILELEDIIPFGKYRGNRIKDIVEDDFDYAKWVIDTVSTHKFSDDVLAYINTIHSSNLKYANKDE